MNAVFIEDKESSISRVPTAERKAKKTQRSL